MDNPVVVAAKLRRKLVAGLSVAGVFALAVLPAEHVHARSDHGPRSEVVHRHYKPHHQAKPDHPVGAGAHVDHPDDDDAQYLSSAFTTAKPAPRVYPADQFVIVAFATVQPQAAAWRRLGSLHVSVHDPPRVSSQGLRAPPPFFV